MLFPDERYGVSYGTNWEISSLGVTVRGEAFKNAGSKTLAMHAKSYDRASKVLGLRSGGEEMLFEGIDLDTFDEIETDAQQVLSKEETLFLTDALPTPSVAVRAVTDDSAYAMLFAQLLRPTELEKCGEKPLQVLHSSLPDEEASGSYCAIGPNKVVMRGSPSPALVVEALAKAAAKQVAQLALPGLLVVDGDGGVAQWVGKNGLDVGDVGASVVGSGASLVDGGAAYPLCHAGFSAAAKGGEARVGLDGLTLNALETKDAGVAPNVLKKVVLVSGKVPGSPKKIDVAKAKEMYAALGWAADAELFEATMTQNGIELFSA